MLLRIWTTFGIALTVTIAVVFLWNEQADATVIDRGPSPVDVGFASSMAVHHRQAIIMAQLMLDGRPTNVARIANNIVNSQLYEYGEMQGWLQLWDEPLNKTADEMEWLLQGEIPPSEELMQYLIDCRESPEGMVGLASLAEIEKLRVLEGDERDAHFLKLMLAHHEGGIPMARFAADQSKLAVVKRRAKTVVLEQTVEIDQMKRALHVMELLASYSPKP